jgi:glycosyltransferase involved in cell wall biosynthesis
MERPLVSVLMTSYNREKYIAESIESVLASTYRNFELIIVDDCSKDHTVEIARSYEQKDARIKIHVNEKNLGDYPNRNKAASLAKGKYLKYVDSDDLIYPHGLEVMVNAMEKFPQAAHGFPRYNRPYGPHPVQITSSQAIREHYLGEGLFEYAPNSIIIRAEHFFKEGSFTSEPWILQSALGDVEMWMRLGLKYPIAIFSADVVWGRIHGEQESHYKQKSHEVAYAKFKLNLLWLDKIKGELEKEEADYAERRLKQNYARYILSQTFRKRDIISTYRLYKKSKLTLVELLNGFKGYSHSV